MRQNCLFIGHPLSTFAAGDDPMISRASAQRQEKDYFKTVPANVIYLATVWAKPIISRPSDYPGERPTWLRSRPGPHGALVSEFIREGPYP